MLEAPPSSPTTSIFRIIVTLAVSLLLSLVLDARGIVHSAQGMPDGPARSAALAVGQSALRVAQATHLDWPWDHLQAALGRAQQPIVPPLLAGGYDPPLVQSRPRGRSRRTLRFVQAKRGCCAREACGAGIHRGARVTVVDAASARRSAHDALYSITSPGRAGASDGAACRLTVYRARQRARSQVARQPALRQPVGQQIRSYPLRRPTPRNPLRLLVAGDSLSGYLGPELVDEASRIAPVRGFVETHNGTGLTRPDFVDWSVIARQQVAAHNPDAVVVLIGGNDFQNMTLPPNRFFLAGTPAWTREYQRRAAICLRIWAQNGAGRVYWLSLPPARNPDWARIDGQINVALSGAAAQVPGARYVNILGHVTDHGRYADFVTYQGRPLLVREPDGIHLNITGSTIAAHDVLAVIQHEWRLGCCRSRR